MRSFFFGGMVMRNFLYLLIIAAALITHINVRETRGDTLHRVAVLELSNDAEITESEAYYLTDKVRDAASRVLTNRGFLVITRENLQELLPPGTDLSKCGTAECEVEIGRTIGTDYIVTGEILKFSGEFRANLKAHHSSTGAFLGAEACKGKSLTDLEESIANSSLLLFNKILAHSGAGPVSPTGPTVQPGAIGETSTGAWDLPTGSQVVVRFESNPPGAVVMVDGQLKCQQTPCGKSINAGSATISMQRERYQARQEIVQIKNGMAPLSWKLSPTFGWLSVESNPSGLSVMINGEASGTTPLKKHELDPGAYEVMVTDPRYVDKGERINLSAGERKTVSVTLAAREGGLSVSAQDQSGNDLAGEVFLDGAKVGSAPGSFKAIVGKHKLEVRTGRGLWSGEIEIKEQQVTPVMAKVWPDSSSPAVSGGLGAGGTVWIDATADLIWQVSPTGGKMKLKEARAHCQGLTLGGHSDWRLPTISELRSLIRGCQDTQAGGSCKVTDSALSRKHWEPRCKGCWSARGPGSAGAYWPPKLSGKVSRYWSSSDVEIMFLKTAWFIDFTIGGVDSHNVRFDHNVRCVR
jgi:Protein of unknown function (DUF1566)/PEGA domain